MLKQHRIRRISTSTLRDRLRRGHAVESHLRPSVRSQLVIAEGCRAVRPARAGPESRRHSFLRRRVHRARAGDGRSTVDGPNSSGPGDERRPLALLGRPAATAG